MKQKTKLGFIILAAAAGLGLAAPALAQDAAPAAPAAPTADSSAQRWGLLGTAYSGADFIYEHVESSSPSEWRGFALDFNKPISAGLDFNFAYDWKEADNYLLRLRQQDLLGGVTLFRELDWGKPYAQALAGWEWHQGGVASDNSFAYVLGTGVEFQVASAWVVTPYVNFMRATSFNRSEFDFGVKTAYRLNREWSLTAGLEYAAVQHAKDGTGFSIGVKYHY